MGRRGELSRMTNFIVYVYSKGLQVDSFVITSDGFAAAQVEAAKHVRENYKSLYSDAYVGKVEKC